MGWRRNDADSQFKARVALEAFRGDRTIQAITAKHQVHPNQVSVWKRQAQTGLEELFAATAKRGPTEQEALIYDPTRASLGWY